MGYIVRAGEEVGRAVAGEAARMRRGGGTEGAGGEAEAATAKRPVLSESSPSTARRGMRGRQGRGGGGDEGGGDDSDRKLAGRGRVVIGMHIRRGHKAIEVMPTPAVD